MQFTVLHLFFVEADLGLYFYSMTCQRANMGLFETETWQKSRSSKHQGATIEVVKGEELDRLLATA